MPRQFLAVAALTFFACLSASAQTVLPNSFGPWASPGVSRYTPGVTPAGKTAGAVAKEYDFVSGEHGFYSRNGDMLDVTLYRMKDPSGAYGEYSYLRSSDMPRTDLTEHSSMSNGRALALVGNFVVDILGSNLPKLTPDLKTLVSIISKSAGTGPLPWIGGRLPTDDMIQRSDHYILGPVALNEFFPLGADDWLGFSHGAEAETAQYQLNGKTVTLLLADFPTPQIAQDELSRLGKEIQCEWLEFRRRCARFSQNARSRC